MPHTTGQDAPGGSEYAALPRRIAVLLDKFPTRKAASRIAGVSVDQLAHYVAGRSKPSFHVLARLADAAGLSLDWLATGVERPGAAQPVPLRGLAACGLKGWFHAEALHVTVTPPGDLRDPDAFAVMAIGQSMRPAGVLPGFICVCAPTLAPARGDAVFVERTDGYATIKELAGADGRWLTLTGYLDPDAQGVQAPYTDRIARSQVALVAPVVWTRRKL